MSHVVVAEVVRSGFVEGRHHGSVVRVDPAGEVAWSLGDPYAPVFPRSCNKPLQAAALVRAGLPVRGRLLALVAASHSGEPAQLDVVREILAGAGLDERALRTPPSYPLDDAVREEYVRAGGEPAPICMDCSGKHAGMLATCVVNGWDTASYLAPDHPVQRAIADTFVDLTGAQIPVTGVDGCGAPLLGASLVGLARAFTRIVRASAGAAEAAVRDAVTGWPELVSGRTRDEAMLLRAFPGAIAKAGAEGCYALAMPDGTAFALKIDDGAGRARRVVMSEALRVAGYSSAALDEAGSVPLLGGGDVVGSVRPAFGSA